VSVCLHPRFKYYFERDFNPTTLETMIDFDFKFDLDSDIENYFNPTTTLHLEQLFLLESDLDLITLQTACE